MRVLVTGGAGFIGSHIVDALLARGHRVLVIDNLSTGSRENLNGAAELLVGDIREASQVTSAYELLYPEAVIHLAAQADVRRSMDDPAFDAGVNLIGTLNLLEGARRYGAVRFVFASTGGAVYGEPARLPVGEDVPAAPLSCYGASKRAAEDYIRVYGENHGLRTTVLRYANVYGPRQDPRGEAGVVAIFSLALLTGNRPTIFGDGSKTRDYVHVSDVVRANLLALDKGIDGVFNIGTGRRVTDQEVFETVRRAAGSPLEAIHGMRRKGEVEHICLDVSRASAGLGWKPEVSFEEGVREAVAYYRSRLPGARGA